MIHPRPIKDRFWEKVKKTKSCWNWTGKTKTTRGYGVLWFGGGKTISAHRFSYEIHNGKIPNGLQIDHLCRNRKCVNPEHLEAVTDKVNVLRGIGLSAMNARKTHCKNGHPFNKQNTWHYKGQRVCRICKRINQNIRRKLKKQKI